MITRAKAAPGQSRYADLRRPGMIPFVAEYTISTASGNDWPAIPGDFEAVLQPRSLECEPVEGGGDHSFRTGPMTVSASWELAGTWYVSIDGAASLEAADSIAAEMAQQLGQATGETTKYYRITD